MSVTNTQLATMLDELKLQLGNRIGKVEERVDEVEKSVDNHDKEFRGNGNPGMKHRIKTLELKEKERVEREKEQMWLPRAILLIIIGELLARVFGVI